MMKRMLIFILLFFQSTLLKADLAHGVINKYRNHVLVNTKAGWYGNFALPIQAGFSKIYILDEDKVLIEHYKIILPQWLHENKQEYPINYYLYHAQSQTDLELIIKRIEEPITFFLNSYIPNPDQSKKRNNLMEELEQIKNHPIKKHTILIDYINQAATPSFDNLDLSTIKQKLLEINPQYILTFELGGHMGKEQNAILAAYLK